LAPLMKAKPPSMATIAVEKSENISESPCVLREVQGREKHMKNDSNKGVCETAQT
jgi:hypothetical protein